MGGASKTVSRKVRKGAKDSKTSHRLGQWGETFVAEFLQRESCKIVASRWRCRYGEIDLVAEDGVYLRFVEVKLRTNPGWSLPREAVDARKQKKLRLTAELYLAEHPTGLQPRFDVAEVYVFPEADTDPQIQYIADAF